MENFSENAMEENKNFLTNGPEERYFLTSELEERYGIGKTTKNERLSALYIKPVRQGRNFVVNAEQLKLMDEFHAHLEAKGKMNEFVQQCIESGRIVPPQEPKAEAIVVREPEAQVVTIKSQPQQEVVAVEEIELSPESSEQEMITNLQAQKGAQMQANDIQKVAERAQKRAFSKAAAEETLTLLYEATEEFTIPGLKEQLEQHRAACDQARKKRDAAYNVNNFLSQALKTVLPKVPNG